MRNSLTKLLGIEYPIIQAPMAGGITTPNLVASVSNSGGLGMAGAGYMSPKQIRGLVREIKRKTDKRFGINLFIPQDFSVSEDETEKIAHLLQPILTQFNLETEPAMPPTIKAAWDNFRDQIKVVIDERVPVCSFTFGVPSKEIIAKLKKRDIVLLGTATTVEEALINEEIGFDAVVIQGSEAGGHRGTFTIANECNMIGLISLIPQVVSRVKIPVIAAGGIMDGKGLMAARILGALGVQMGTAFLTCTESGAHPAHKEAILKSNEDQTVVTRVYTGKWARGIKNKFYKEMREQEENIPEFPIQNILTGPIRNFAANQNNPEYMALWAGQSASLSKAITVKELMKTIISETEGIKKNLIK